MKFDLGNIINMVNKELAKKEIYEIDGKYFIEIKKEEIDKLKLMGLKLNIKKVE